MTTVNSMTIIDLEEEPDVSPEDGAAATHARYLAAIGRAEAALRTFELLTLDGDYEPTHAGVAVDNVVHRLQRLLEACTVPNT